MAEEVIVVSLRKGAPPVPAGYAPVRVDRACPTLGNPYFPRAETPEERASCIGKYRVMAEHDVARGGPISRKVRDLADRVDRGERLALQCWCKPKDCHGDVVRELILRELGSRRRTT